MTDRAASWQDWMRRRQQNVHLIIDTQDPPGAGRTDLAIRTAERLRRTQ